MAKSQIVSAKDRRQMLKDNSGGLAQAGRSFLEAGRTGEALECFAAAQDAQGLADIAALGLETGDFFVASQAKRLLGQELSPDELSEIRQRAQQAGKAAFAQRAEAVLAPDPEDS